MTMSRKISMNMVSVCDVNLLNFLHWDRAYNEKKQKIFVPHLIGYQVKWNGPSEPILFDNSEIRKMDMTDDDDYDEDDVDEAGNVILIESEDDGSGESGSLRASGRLNVDGSSSDAGGDRKMYECDICCRKVASSYNLKRHMMIHTGKLLLLFDLTAEPQFPLGTKNIPCNPSR